MRMEGGEDLLELLVGGGEFGAADAEQLLGALGVVGEVVDAALRVLHALDELFEFLNGLGVGHCVVIFHIVSF